MRFQDAAFEMGLEVDGRKPVLVFCEQHMRRSACASAQTTQRLCYLLFWKVSYLQCTFGTCEISIIKLVSVAIKNTGLSLALWETQKTSFVATWPINYADKTKQLYAIKFNNKSDHK